MESVDGAEGATVSVNAGAGVGAAVGAGGDTQAQITPEGSDLPETARVVEVCGVGGGRVVVVGTAHFSRRSQEDVARAVRAVQPSVVVVELCEQRVNILLADEETILREAESIDLSKIRASIARSGLLDGLMYVLLLNMSARLTRALGAAPGGEFRTALAEARRLARCSLQLGDRPIDITLRRALAALSWWQSARLACRLLLSDCSITVEELEKCKQQKMLEEMLEEMGEEFPSLKRVFVEERDVYLAHSLRLALASAGAASPAHVPPPTVLAVVGIGHVAGILRHLHSVNADDVTPLLRVPERALSTRVVVTCAKLACVGALVYATCRLVARARLLTL